MEMQQRIDSLARPSNFVARVDFSEKANMLGMNWAEMKLLYDDLKLVEKAATVMAAGMVKGIIKYGKGASDRTPQDWLTYLIDDAADVLNYVFLLQASMLRDSTPAYGVPMSEPGWRYTPVPWTCR